MDRLTASSTDPPPDWPLSSFPPPSLINVSKESKRHCRLLPAGMVSLSLTQMADAANHVEQKKLHEQHKKLDYKKVEFTEYDFEKWAFECKKVQKKRNLEKKKMIAEEQKSIEPHSVDEMLESVDALLSTLESPTATTKPPKPSKTTMPNPPPSPTASTMSIAELPASSPVLPPPSPSPFSPSPKPPKAPLSTPAPSPLPIDPTTALHSHPPSSSEIQLARNLTAAHRKHVTSQKVSHSHSQRRLLPPNPLAAFDAMTEYGKIMQKRKKSPLTFAGAVNKGFGEVVMMAAKVGRKTRMRKEGALARVREGRVKFGEVVRMEVKGFLS